MRAGTAQGARLAASALVRSFRKHRVRALAAIAAGVVGVALTTAVFVITFSVLDAIRGVPLTAVDRADWAVVARSSSGMEQRLAGDLRDRLPRADVAPALLVDTRLAGGSQDRLLVVGATPALEKLMSRGTERQVADLPDLGPGEVWLTDSWARRHGARRGETVRLQSPRGVERWKVRGLIDDAFGNGGAVAVGALPAVAQAFGRGPHADVIFVGGPGDRREQKRAIESVVEEAGSVVEPSRTTESYAKSFSSIRRLLAMFALVAVLTAAAIVFFAWRLTIEDQRANLARLRLVGGSRRHLAGAAGLLLFPWLGASMLLGGPLGIALGSSLSGFSRDLVTMTQLAAQPSVPVVRPVLAAFVVATVVFGIAWAASMVALVRVPVIEAVTGRRSGRRKDRTRPLAAVAVATALLAAAALALLPGDARALAALPLLALLAAGALLGPKLVGALVRRAPGWTALNVGRELAHGAGRTAALVGVFALAIAVSVALEGTASSLQRDMAASVEAWTKADAFVQTSKSGVNLEDDKFVPAVEDELAAVDGVEATGWFTYSTLEMGARRVPLWSWGGADGPERFVELDVVKGPRGAGLWRALDGRGVAVSTNYARLNDVTVGDRMTLPTDAGKRDVKVAAVVKDLVSDSGVIIADQTLYEEVTGDGRRYQLLADTKPGASVADVRRRLEDRLGDRYPQLVVWDRDQIRTHFEGVSDQLLQAYRAFARVMFVLALLIGATTVAASLSVRRRALAVVQLVGAPRKLLRRQVLGEHAGLGAVAWLVGLPIGLALVPALTHAIALGTGLLPDVRLPWGAAILALPLSVALAAASLLGAGRGRSTPPVAEALADE